MHEVDTLVDDELIARRSIFDVSVEVVVRSDLSVKK